VDKNGQLQTQRGDYGDEVEEVPGVRQEKTKELPGGVFFSLLNQKIFFYIHLFCNFITYSPAYSFTNISKREGSLGGTKEDLAP
jgi:hypothetical protein